MNEMERGGKKGKEKKRKVEPKERKKERQTDRQTDIFFHSMMMPPPLVPPACDQRSARLLHAGLLLLFSAASLSRSAEAAEQQPGSLYMWIDSDQARILIGLEEDIVIVSEGRMAPFTEDFRKAQQTMPAIPVNIPHVNFTWSAARQEQFFYEFQALRSLDRDIMDHPTVNLPLLGTVPHKPSVIQVGFPCLGDQDGVAAFEVTLLVMDSGGTTILRTPHNAIFFKTCQKAKCPGGCRNGGFCNDRQVCECQDGFYGAHCEKALCSPRCVNGGVCVSPGVCVCPPGYQGDSCDKANCSTVCLNGGTCFHPGKCICTAGHEGAHCEMSKCRMQPCRNGGKCTGRNKCKCSKGFYGDLCTKAVCEPGCGSHGSCVEPNKCQCRDGWHGRHCNKRHRGGVSGGHRQFKASPSKDTETAQRSPGVMTPGQRSPGGVSKEVAAGEGGRPAETNYVM